MPSSHIIHEGLERIGENPVAYGGFADVWEGAYVGDKVCAKALRIYNRSANPDNKAFAVCVFRNPPMLPIKVNASVSLFTGKLLSGRG
jgi:hypothetical protein